MSHDNNDNNNHDNENHNNHDNRTLFLAAEAVAVSSSPKSLPIGKRLYVAGDGDGGGDDGSDGGAGAASAVAGNDAGVNNL